MKDRMAQPALQTSDPPQLAAPPARRALWIGALVILLLCLAMFADVLFTGRSILLGSNNMDIARLMLFWKQFGFGELRKGNLPLWNPHVFCGEPYVGGIHPAMFYPPNYLHMVLPDAVAINWLIALHLLLGGWGMYVWARSRNLSVQAGLLSATIFMFSGAHFLRIPPGHLCALHCIAWIPLWFWSLDRFFKSRSLGCWLVATGLLTMQILAGHPQVLFYTMIATALYLLFCLIHAHRRGQFIAGTAGIFAAAGLLTAIQMLTGMDAAGESVRSQGTPLYYAAMFSFPPENVLTLLAPGFFGDGIKFEYWGRCYLMEMSLFMGVTGFALALYGAIFGPPEQRRFSGLLAPIMLLLAFGNNTPLFEVLYYNVPGFKMFRGNSKFIVQASLFAAMLAGIGFDRFRQHTTQPASKHSRLFPLLVGIAALVTAGAGLVIYKSTIGDTAGWWRGILQAINISKESYLPIQAFSDPIFFNRTGQYAAKCLFIAAGTLALLAAMLFMTKYSSRLFYALLALAIVELFVFARYNRTTYDPSIKPPDMVKIDGIMKNEPGDYRIHDLVNPNAAVGLKAYDIWGYDPGVSLRYAQFMTFTQRQNPDTASQYVTFTKPHPLFRMLRLRYIVHGSDEEIAVGRLPNGLPTLKLITDFTVLTERDQIFATMDQQSFDPAKQVILEQLPNPVPVSSESPGSARIVDSSTDHMTVEADVAQPAILLITDGYSKGWRINPLPGSSQQQYELLPANYVLRAVPLAAGHHVFKMEYAPAAFTIGKWITIVSLTGYLALAAWWGWKTHTARKWAERL